MGTAVAWKDWCWLPFLAREEALLFALPIAQPLSIARRSLSLWWCLLVRLPRELGSCSCKLARLMGCAKAARQLLELRLLLLPL